MYSRIAFPLASLMALSNLGCNAVPDANGVKYEATIESLQQYECAD